MRFLHTYLGLVFRATARPEPPTIALSAYVRSAYRSTMLTGLDIAAPLYPFSLKTRLGETSRFRTLCGIKAIYCTSIRQRELHCSCQLNWLNPITDGVHIRYAYAPILLAVKAKISPLRAAKVLWYSHLYNSSRHFSFQKIHFSSETYVEEGGGSTQSDYKSYPHTYCSQV